MLFFTIPILKVKWKKSLRRFFPARINTASVGPTLFFRATSPFRERWVEGSSFSENKILRETQMAHEYLHVM